jgi:hypothetical protein
MASKILTILVFDSSPTKTGDHLTTCCVLFESHFFLGLASIRDKELLSEFIHAELSDHFLRGGIGHELHEGQRSIIIDLGPLIGGDCHDMINV